MHNELHGLRPGWFASVCVHKRKQDAKHFHEREIVHAGEKFHKRTLASEKSISVGEFVFVRESCKRD